MTPSLSKYAGAVEPQRSPFEFRGSTGFHKEPGKDWITVRTGSVSIEMVIWLDTNLKQRWSVIPRVGDRVTYMFESADDAFAFKMRWGGGKVGLTT